jgi:hypothetical protein
MAKKIKMGRKPGRIQATQLQMRASSAFIATIDAWAERAGLSRSDAVRALIERGIESKAPIAVRKALAGEFRYHVGQMPRELPSDGWVVVHNHVRHGLKTRPGTNGFRSWEQRPSDGLEPCDCGWSGLPHYRVARKDDKP